MCMKINLRVMTESEYDIFLVRSITEFAKGKEEAEGITPKAAMELSTRTFAELLPEGLSTPDNYLYSYTLEAKVVGNVWFAKRGDGCFIYELYLEENLRGKGLGKQLMALIDEEAKGLGFKTIRLHVFAHNKVAIKLYENTGYVPTNINMVKHL